MILRRFKRDGSSAKTTNLSLLSPKAPVELKVEGSAMGVATRKPSERFMHKPLTARSKASASERARVVDLGIKLGSNDTHNEGKFNGYRPGFSGPPG